LEDGRENLKRLSEASGGRLLNDVAELRRLPQRKDLALREPLLVLALLVFLLERYAERRRRELSWVRRA